MLLFSSSADVCNWAIGHPLSIVVPFFVRHFRFMLPSPRSTVGRLHKEWAVVLHEQRNKGQKRWFVQPPTPRHTPSLPTPQLPNSQLPTRNSN